MGIADKNPDALKSLELAIAKLEKQYGKNTVFYGDAMPEDVDVIPTQNFIMDLALGVGGLPKGRIIEIFGGEALGKTLYALSCAASVQKEGGLVAYIDAECDLDPSWARVLGVDFDKLLVSQPESGEEGLEIAEALIKTGAVDLVVIDSVAALTPKMEIEGTMEDNHVAGQPRMMAQAMRKLRQPASENNVCLLFLNQIRDKIGFMSNGGTTSPGGRALKFAASVRIELKRMGEEKSPLGESIGTKIKAIILKNKVSRPGVVVEYKILHGIGFNTNEQVIELATKFGLVNKSGAWYSTIEDKKNFAQGLANAATYLDEHPEFKEELMINIKKCYEATR